MDAPIVSRSNTDSVYQLKATDNQTKKFIFGEIIQVKAATHTKPRRMKAMCFKNLHEMKHFNNYVKYKIHLRQEGIKDIPPYQPLDPRNLYLGVSLGRLSEKDNPYLIFEARKANPTGAFENLATLTRLEEIQGIVKEKKSLEPIVEYRAKWNGKRYVNSTKIISPADPTIINLFRIKFTKTETKEFTLGEIIVVKAKSEKRFTHVKPKRLLAYIFDNMYEMKNRLNYLRYKIAMEAEGVKYIPPYRHLDPSYDYQKEHVKTLQDDDNIDDLRNKHSVELEKQILDFRKKYPHKKINLETFIPFRTRRQRENLQTEENLKVVNSYISKLQNQEYYNLLLNKGLGVNGDDHEKAVEKDVEGNYIIRDFDCYLRPFIRMIAGRPYNRTPSASVKQIGDVYQQIRQSRAEFIATILSFDNIKQYFLYKEETLVAYKIDGELKIVEQDLFDLLTQEPSPKELFESASQPITEEFINRSVKMRDIPETLASVLRKRHLNQKIDEAMFKTPANINRVNARRIVIEEITPLPEKESQYFWHLEYYLNGKNEKKSGKPLAVNFNEFKNQINKNLRVKNVYHYLIGKISLEDLGITSENARDFLDIVKAADLCIAYINSQSLDKIVIASSYDIRCKILSLASKMSTCEAFTRTLNPKKWSDAHYCKRMNSWLPHRVNQQFVVLVRHYIQMRLLSNDLNHLLILRGNTATGKSTAISHIVNQAGVMDPDKLKFLLKKIKYSGGVIKVLNKYIHGEVSGITDDYFGEIMSSTRFLYVLDTRMTTVAKLKAGAQDPAEKRKTSIVVQDTEGDLLTSCNRVLVRKIDGEPPVVELDAIYKAMILIRQQRRGVLHQVESDERIIKYELKYRNELVAKKVDGKIKIENQKLFEECLRVPEMTEIEELLSRKIDEKYVQEAIEKNDFKNKEEYEILRYWSKRNLSIRDAVSAHVEGEEAQL